LNATPVGNVPVALQVQVSPAAHVPENMIAEYEALPVPLGSVVGDPPVQPSIVGAAGLLIAIAYAWLAICESLCVIVTVKLYGDPVALVGVPPMVA
jgi:hypothetical protein